MLDPAATPPEDRFVPPEPTPLPRVDGITGAAWIGLLGGPLILVIAAVLGGAPFWLLAAAVAGLVGGFIVLVSRLPRRDEVDPDDDGAVV